MELLMRFGGSSDATRGDPRASGVIERRLHFEEALHVVGFSARFRAS